MRKKLDCLCHAVDKEGNVWSCLYQFSHKGTCGIQTKKTNKWKKLVPQTSSRGYHHVNIHGKIVRLNRLIAKTYLRNKKNLPYVLHNNGNPVDNCLENLRWGTPKENEEDSKKHGVRKLGEKTYNHKLTEEKVKKIRIWKKEGMTFNAIGRKLNLDSKTVWAAVNKVTWQHV